jgi:hypothetical protein
MTLGIDGKDFIFKLELIGILGNLGINVFTLYSSSLHLLLET